MEDVEVAELLTVGREHDRLADHPRDRQRRATTRIAVELGEHHTVDADTLLERQRGVDRVLADHRVHHEQGLVRLGERLDHLRLAHHLGVHTQPAGGVDDHHIEKVMFGVVDGVLGDLNRIADTIAGLRRVDADLRPLGDHPQLLDSLRTLQVGCHQQRRMTLLLQPSTQLAGQSRLAGALKAGEHDDRRRLLGVAQQPGLAAEDGDEFVIDDLDDLLARVERPRQFCSARTLLDA